MRPYQQRQMQQQQQQLYNQQIMRIRNGTNRYANNGQNPGETAVGATIFMIFLAFNMLVILVGISQSRQSEQNAQKQQQEQCKTWPNPANRPPWCK